MKVTVERLQSSDYGIEARVVVDGEPGCPVVELIVANGANGFEVMLFGNNAVWYEDRKPYETVRRWREEVEHADS